MARHHRGSKVTTSGATAGEAPSRGHHDKIDAAVAKVRANGLLRAGMRTGERDDIVLMQLVADGWTGNHLPTRFSIRRYFQRIAGRQSHQSHGDTAQRFSHP
jgi:hypothetical protein